MQIDHLIHGIHLYISLYKAMVFNWEWFCLPEDTGSIEEIFFFLNKKFYWRKIETPHTQGKEHKNSTDTELRVTTTQCCLWLLFNFLNGFPQFFK